VEALYVFSFWPRPFFAPAAPAAPLVAAQVGQVLLLVHLPAVPPVLRRPWARREAAMALLRC